MVALVSENQWARPLDPRAPAWVHLLKTRTLLPARLAAGLTARLTAGLTARLTAGLAARLTAGLAAGLAAGETLHFHWAALVR